MELAYIDVPDEFSGAVIQKLSARKGDSDIFWKGMGLTSSGEQRVSPIWISEMPEIATMEPMPASFTSTRFKPSNSYSFETLTFRILSGS